MATLLPLQLMQEEIFHFFLFKKENFAGPQFPSLSLAFLLPISFYHPSPIVPSLGLSEVQMLANINCRFITTLATAVAAVSRNWIATDLAFFTCG